MKRLLQRPVVGQAGVANDAVGLGMVSRAGGGRWAVGKLSNVGLGRPRLRDSVS